MRRYATLLAVLLFTGAAVAGNSPSSNVSMVQRRIPKNPNAVWADDHGNPVTDEDWKKAFAFADRLEDEAERNRIKAASRWYDPYAPMFAPVLRRAKQTNMIAVWGIGGLSGGDKSREWTKRMSDLLNPWIRQTGVYEIEEYPQTLEKPHPLADTPPQYFPEEPENLLPKPLLIEIEAAGLVKPRP